MSSWLVLVLALNAVTPSNQPTPRLLARFAIVIGHNAPDHSSGTLLRYADDDAVTTSRLLREAEVETVLLVDLDEDSKTLYPQLEPTDRPTPEALQRAVRQVHQRIRLARSKGRATEFLLFYSGHGNSVHGQGYVVLDGGKLTRQQLFEEILAVSPADHNHVIIDACQSYYLVFERGAPATRKPFTGQLAPSVVPADLTNTGFVLSTSSGRESHEWERLQAGVFSHEVRSALRGAADADRDGQITYSELGAFLTVANQGIANARFRPQFILRPPGTPPGELERPILAWSDAASSLLLDEPGLGHLYVEDQQGLRLLDAHASKEQTLRLQLPGQRPLFVHRVAEQEEYLIDEVGPQSISALPTQPLRIAQKGALHLAFEQLFGQPFSAAAVATYRDDYRAEQHRLVHVEPQPTSWEPLVYWTSLSTAIGATASAAALNLLAFQRQRAGADASQRRRADLNDQIRDLNRASIAMYAAAGTALATWLALVLLSDEAPALVLTPVIQPDAAASGFTVIGRF